MNKLFVAIYAPDILELVRYVWKYVVGLPTHQPVAPDERSRKTKDTLP